MKGKEWRELAHRIAVREEKRGRTVEACTIYRNIIIDLQAEAEATKFPDGRQSFVRGPQAKHMSVEFSANLLRLHRQGYTCKQLGEKYDMSKSAVWSRIQDAREAA